MNAGDPMIETQKVAEMLGGSKIFHHTITSDLEFFDEIKRGFPIKALERLVDIDLLSKNEVNDLIISFRTLARRKKEKHLSPEESDRLARIARIMSYAEQVMGNIEKALRWLRRPNRALGNKPPLEFLGTESGARIVESILARIEQGIYS